MLVVNKTGKIFFKIVPVLIQNNSPQGPVNLKHLKFSLFCYIMV